MKRIICVVFFAVLVFNTLSVSAYNTSAKAAVVIDGFSGELLYSQNSDRVLPMASTTKIMTALLLCEMGGDLKKEIVTTREMVTVEGSSMGLQVGDRVTYHDLLYGMLLSSGNDAANTTAIAVGGSISGFVELMNKKAQQMGLKNTHFVTPSGLDAEGHHTTAYELALIAKAALQNESFAKAAASKSARLCYGNPPYNRTLKNHNRLLKMYDDVVGVKTGFTKKSGRCLVSAARLDGKFVIAVTLNDPNDWADHRALLDLGLSLVESKTFSAKYPELSIETADGQMVFATVPDAMLSITKQSRVTYKINSPRFLYTPIQNGQKVGEIEYFLNDNSVCKKDITSNTALKQKTSKLNIFFQIFITILSNV